MNESQTKGQTSTNKSNYSTSSTTQLLENDNLSDVNLISKRSSQGLSLTNDKPVEKKRYTIDDAISANLRN